MELIRGLAGLKERHRGCAVTIGTFDGIHLGHRALIERLLARARRAAVPAMLVTFEPMPREYFRPEDPPARLTSLRERWRLLTGYGIDFVWLLRFEARLRNLTGEAFAGLLGREARARTVVVGHDFKFGRGGEANVPLLERVGAESGFDVEVVPPITLEGERISSSGVRAALARGDLELAGRWLGRPYSMAGRVVRGERLGRELGYPTANLRIERRRAPLTGIFATWVHGIGTHPLAGVASLGTRPTVAGTGMLLETHVFDFSGDLYGREIEVEFVAKLRDERRFASLEELVAQMHWDAAQARGVLS